MMTAGYYNYHARNLERIKNGELIGVEKSNTTTFAFVLLFKTYPFTRPIRPHAIWRYAHILKEYNPTF